MPEWNFDGSSCYQANTENSEIILKPVAFYPDPFKQQNNVIVFCECYKWSDKTYTKLTPVGSNLRYHGKKIFDKVTNDKVWFGIEQEYTIMQEND